MLANAAWIYVCMVISDISLLFLDANFSRGNTAVLAGAVAVVALQAGCQLLLNS